VQPGLLRQIGFNAWPDGRLGLIFTDSTENVILSGTTEIITTTGFGEMLIAYSFEPPDSWKLWLNGTKVQEAQDPNSQGCTIALDPIAGEEPLSFEHPDARLACRGVMKLRLSQQRRTKSISDRTLTLHEELRNLEEVLRSLSDDLVAVVSGKDYKWRAIRAALRELMCTGGKNYNPLLQRVAAALDQPLPIYANRKVKIPLKFHSEVGYGYFGCKKNKASNVLIDLDEWLQRHVVRHKPGGLSEILWMT